MKILIAPLNWGLGHASRCIPLIRQYVADGHEVILGGDGDSLVLLRKHFPQLRYVYLAPLTLRYSSGKRQVWAMIRALPQIIRWAIKDHMMLRAVLHEEKIDRVISDNRFGLYNKEVESIYITHQLHIMFPKIWKWLESLAENLHARICTRFKEVWIPDFEDPKQNLAGELSHPHKTINGKWANIKLNYLGPLSRFSTSSSPQHNTSYSVVAVLSGLEPQRTILEKNIVGHYRNSSQSVLVVQGLVSKPKTVIKLGNITLVPTMSDEELQNAILGAERIIARSGYSTIMDLYTLGVLEKAELIPTPGQPEQEYLVQYLSDRTLQGNL